MPLQSEFNAAVEDVLPLLNNIVRKIVGHADQCDDVVQDTLTKAWQKYETFQGESEFSTWLCAIGINTAKDYLKSQQRWRSKAQIIYADQCINNPEFGMEVGQSFQDPEIEYDIKEHIAYCFSCVGRSLNPVDQAALILKDVLGLTNIEGAKVLQLSESVFRQHVQAARHAMQSSYDNLCALVNKDGICYQCKGLREGFPEQRRGTDLELMGEGLSFDVRLNIVKGANLHTGKTQRMHEIFWKRTAQQEQDQFGDENVQPDCGKGVATE